MNRFLDFRLVSICTLLIFLVLVLCPLAIPYLQDGYQVAHDRLVPYMRVWSLSQAIASGQFPPRWFPDFDGGYGSPYPSFYGMAFYFSAVAISMPGITIGTAVEVVAFFTFVLSAIGMYFLIKQLWGTASGILAAVGYSYAPYHLVDAFVRGAYSELTAFVWFPFILLSFLRWIEMAQQRWLLVAALSMAGLVLTHNLMPLLFLPFALIFPLLFIYDLHLPFDQIKHRLLGLAWSGILALVLSAYFWIPILLEKSNVRLDYFMEFDYRDGFVSVAELFATTNEHTLTKEAGIVLLLGTLAAFILAVFAKRFQYKATLIGGIFASAMCLYMTTQSSAWLWNLLPFLSFVQFPWRFLSPAVFFLSLSLGILPLFLRNRHLKWITVITISCALIYLSSPLIDIPNRIDAIPLDAQIICQEVWGTQDYRPTWSKTRFWSSPNPPGRPGDPLVLPPCQGEFMPTVNEALSLQTIQRLGTSWQIDLTANTSVGLIIPQFYYPGWRAWLDNQAIAIALYGDNGLMQVVLPAGTHRLQIAFIESPIRTVADWLSGIGLVLAVVTIGRTGKSR